MSNLSREDLYDTLAHPRSDPAVYYAAKTLPAAGASTDPNSGAATAGAGLAVPVPSWARNATIFITYAIGAGGNVSVGLADATVWAGPAVGSPLSLLAPAVSNGNIGTDGAVLLVAGCGGMGTIGLLAREIGDAAHPGIIGVTFVFSQ